MDAGLRVKKISCIRHRSSWTCLRKPTLLMRCLASGMIVSWASLVASGWVSSSMIQSARMRLTCLEVDNFAVHDLPNKMRLKKKKIKWDSNFRGIDLFLIKKHTLISNFWHRAALNIHFLEHTFDYRMGAFLTVHSSTKQRLRKVSLVIVCPTQMRTEAWLIPREEEMSFITIDHCRSHFCFSLLFISLIFQLGRFLLCLKNNCSYLLSILFGNDKFSGLICLKLL